MVPLLDLAIDLGGEGGKPPLPFMGLAGGRGPSMRGGGPAPLMGVVSDLAGGSRLTVWESREGVLTEDV